MCRRFRFLKSDNGLSCSHEEGGLESLFHQSLKSQIGQASLDRLFIHCFGMSDLNLASEPRFA